MNKNNQQPGSADLLPCPFCGGAAKVERGTAKCQAINCRAEIWTLHDAASAEAWNRRAPSPQVAEELPPLPQPMRLSFERPHGVQELFYYTAEQYRQGQRDAIAASRRADVQAQKDRADAIRYRFLVNGGAPLPDVAMPEKIALVEASNALRLVRKYPNMNFIERDKMLDAAIARVSEALAAQPAEGSAQVATAEQVYQVWQFGVGGWRDTTKQEHDDTHAGYRQVVNRPAAVVRAAPAELPDERHNATEEVCSSCGLTAGQSWLLHDIERGAVRIIAAEGATPAGELAHGHRDDYFLLANARRIGEMPIHKIVRAPNWWLASELFATGSNSAHQICVDAGIDPDGLNVARIDGDKHGEQGGGA